jgi:glycine cleavage system H protein
METPGDRRYTAEHEWARLEEDGQITVGITDHAQDQLGDIVYIELPDPETDLQQNQPFGVVESVKAVSDLFAPVSGTVTVVNPKLLDGPEILNDDPYEAGWMIRISPAVPTELEELLGAGAYEELIGEDH